MEDRSDGQYRSAVGSGNGCGNFGVVAIDEIEKVAGEINSSNDDDPTGTFRRRLEPPMTELQTKYAELYSPFDLHDIFMRICRPSVKQPCESVSPTSRS